VTKQPRHGLYGTIRTADNQMMRTDHIGNRLRNVDLLEESREKHALKSVSLVVEEPERHHLLDGDVRHYLYGQRGHATAPEWMARGLVAMRERIRLEYPAIPSHHATAEAIRSYGDYLSLYHPRGQTELLTPFDWHHPFEDALRSRQPVSSSDEPRMLFAEVFGDLDVTREEKEPAKVLWPTSAGSSSRVLVKEVTEKTAVVVKEEWGVVGGGVAVATGVLVAVAVALGV
jgi:hypothetical protein